ncbi:MAG: RNA polymerase sigma factor [Defluviitaleaceae bacterium]|nr:RNA polymerase sigma factor [Defluviitaleaceae bacterium]
MMDYKTIINEELIEKVYLYSFRKLYNKTDAEDLAQDILVEALAQLRKGHEVHSFYSWFWALAHNRYCMFLSKRNKAPSTMDINNVEIAKALYSEDSTKDSVLASEEIHELNYAISRLSAQHREIVIMFYLKEMKVSDIAGVLDIPAGTVKRRLFDARTNIKKEFNNMNNTGKSAYAPATLSKWGNGMAPFSQLNDLIIDQILISCRNESKSINELASEIGVAPVYIEDRLTHPLNCKAMKIDASGKYLTDFCIIPEQVKHNTEYKAGEIYSTIGPEINEILLKKKDYILSQDFYGNTFDYSYLMWILQVFVCIKYGEMAEQYNEKNWQGKVAATNGKDYRLAGSFTLPNEVINRDKIVKTFGSNNMHETFDHSMYGKLHYINWFRDRPFSNRDSQFMINASNMPLILKLIDSNGTATLNSIEEAQAANLISMGAIVKDDNKLKVMVPIIPAECIEKIQTSFEDLLQPLVEKYTNKISRMADEFLLPYIRDDLIEEYAHYVLRMYFWILPYAMYWAVHEGKTLAIPEDYSKTAAGVYIRIG